MREGGIVDCGGDLVLHGGLPLVLVHTCEKPQTPGRLANMACRTKGARDVESRGTTLLARRAPRISRLLLPWEPPIRTYLRERAFFGRPLMGAFGDPALVPGFHRPRVAMAHEPCTGPSHRGRCPDKRTPGT